MNWKLFSGCAVVGAISFIATAGFSYCVGRWHVYFIFQGEMAGFLMCLFGMQVLILAFHEKRLAFRLLAFVVGPGVLIASHFLMPGLMLHAYASGFEKAIFNTASIDQWKSVIESADHWLPNRSGEEWSSEMLPRFVKQVYPEYGSPFSEVEGASTNDPSLGISIYWEGSSYCNAVEIGKYTKSSHKFSSELYRKEYPGNISIVIFIGDETPP